MSAAPEVKTKETIPFWLAVVITALLPLPLALFLGDYNVPLWVSFVVWAQYFVYGASPKAFGKIFVPFAAGVFYSTAGMVLAALLGQSMGSYMALNVGFGLAVAVMVYTMRFVPLFREASLAYFNGMAMMLAVFFTGSHPLTASSGPIVLPIVAGLWAIIAGWFGALLGWFNVTITFPRPVRG